MCHSTTSITNWLKLKIIGSILLILVILLIGLVLVQFMYFPTLKNNRSQIDDELIFAQTVSSFLIEEDCFQNSIH